MTVLAAFRPPKPFSAVDPNGTPPPDDAGDVIDLATLVGRPVELDAGRSGVVVDVVLTGALAHVLGVDVLADGELRFVPWLAMRPRGDALVLQTSAALAPHSRLNLIFSVGPRLTLVTPTPSGTVDRDGAINAA